MITGSGAGAPPGATSTDARRRRSRGPRAAIAVAIAAAIVVAGALAWRAHAARGATAVAGTVAGGQVLAPLAVARDAATGEETAPFSGFAISVETVPPGAVVSIDGKPRGEAPLLAGIDCAPGRTLELRAEKAGLGVSRTVACRRDTLVKTTLRLVR